MFCKKFFSQALLSLFAFNALGGIVPTFAMEDFGKFENSDNNAIDQWFYESWCWDYSFDKKINKNYDKFMSLLEQHKQLFRDCGVELKKDIKEIYKELFKASFNDISFNGFMISGSTLNHNEIPATILIKNTSIDGFSGFTVDFYNKDKRGVTVSSYGYICPCVYKNKEKGDLVFTIKFATSMLYGVDLKFKPYEDVPGDTVPNSNKEKESSIDSNESEKEESEDEKC